MCEVFLWEFKSGPGAVKMAQQSKALAFLPEDQGLILSAYTVPHKHL